MRQKVELLPARPFFGRSRRASLEQLQPTASPARLSFTGRLADCSAIIGRQCVEGTAERPCLCLLVPCELAALACPIVSGQSDPKSPTWPGMPPLLVLVLAQVLLLLPPPLSPIQHLPVSSPSVRGRRIWRICGCGQSQARRAGYREADQQSVFISTRTRRIGG